MEKNLNFKNHYDVNYSIKNEKFKIGRLSDYQLSICKTRLKRILKPSNEQLEQLEAVEYIIKQRSLNDQINLIKQFNKNPFVKAQNSKKLIIAQNTADVITQWLKKTTKLGKKLKK